MKFTIIAIVIMMAVVGVLYMNDQEPTNNGQAYRPSQAPVKNNSIKIY